LSDHVIPQQLVGGFESYRVNVSFQLKQYFHDSNFPEWTKTQAGISVPLTLPEKPASDFGQPRETSCLMCSQIFRLPEREKEFLAHLVSFI
jgi:hypothetical protein